MFCLLNDRFIIRITGKDKFKYLQGLLTNDVNKLSSNLNKIYACFLTPQGKFFADFFLFLSGEDLYIDISAIRKEEIIFKLNLYKLRSEIEIEPTNYKVVAIFDENPSNLRLNDSFIFLDPRSEKMGYRGFIEANEIEELKKQSQEMENCYEIKRIKLLIPEGDKDLIPEKSFLLEYGLDKLSAIDFNKGCYLGQELVARTYYRGEIRKKIYAITANEELPSAGHEILANNIKLGIVCSSYKKNGLALIRTEELSKIDPSAKLVCNDIEIEIKESF